MRSSIGESFTVALTVKVSGPALSITTMRLEPNARRMPEKSWRLPSDGAPATGATITLMVGTCGRVGAAAAVWAGFAGSSGTSGMLTPAATCPGARASTVGGLPIRVAMRGAACWAMRDTRRSLPSAMSSGRATVLLTAGPWMLPPPPSRYHSIWISMPRPKPASRVLVAPATLSGACAG